MAQNRRTRPRIGLNALYWVPDAMGGTQTYLLKLVENLVRVDADADYVLFVSAAGARRLALQSENLRVRVCPVAPGSRLLRVLWEQVMLPRHVRRERLDLLHSLGYIGPLRLAVPSVVTVLDMVHYRYPLEIEWHKRRLWKLLFPRSLRRADRAIAISESVKADIAEEFPWAAPKTVPIPLGVDTGEFVPLADSGMRLPAADNSSKVVLSVASASPHKNLSVLVRACAALVGRMPDMRLVLVGMQTEGSRHLADEILDLGIEARVQFTGRISQAELVGYYRRAAVLAFPSLYEGFGLPVLEAMACGCPVVASDRPAIREVAGDGALFFDPLDAEALSAALHRVLSSSDLRADLKGRGLARSRRYSWGQTASRTAAVYRDCLEHGSAAR